MVDDPKFLEMTFGSSSARCFRQYSLPVLWFSGSYKILKAILLFVRNMMPLFGTALN